MPTAKKAPPQHLWWVRHPECGLAIVDAPDWALATVEAAAWWEVPWKKVAALCECEREEIVPRHVCIRCGTIFNGEGPAVRSARSLNGTGSSTNGPERETFTAV